MASEAPTPHSPPMPMPNNARSTRKVAKLCANPWPPRRRSRKQGQSSRECGAHSDPPSIQNESATGRNASVSVMESAISLSERWNSCANCRQRKNNQKEIKSIQRPAEKAGKQGRAMAIGWRCCRVVVRHGGSIRLQVTSSTPANTIQRFHNGKGASLVDSARDTARRVSTTSR